MKFKIMRASHTVIDDEINYPGPDVKNAYKEVRIPYEGSDEVTDWYVDVNTLEELIELRKEVGYDLIFNEDEIWICDDYME